MVCKDRLALSGRPTQGSRRSIDDLEAADRPAGGRQRRPSIDRQHISGPSTADVPLRKTGLWTIFADHR
ncbi:hypothetical protein CROQUDRAFT_89690 [Cronartium quercuum f. sp. fusiforme G11]|uniref:Uncharacterized protein n=1 Tax=Cronartium quercuum f. sp. fusiforme G11 TaxID=708437 RepID=A0A9P6TFL0_9BASI|nr:hypothetical protein CROQUDRAFT_89690 [Cronartium quercuum f. sp. fusiforme G11]